MENKPGVLYNKQPSINFLLLLFLIDHCLFIENWLFKNRFFFWFKVSY